MGLRRSKQPDPDPGLDHLHRQVRFQWPHGKAPEEEQRGVPQQTSSRYTADHHWVVRTRPFPPPFTESGGSDPGDPQPGPWACSRGPARAQPIMAASRGATGKACAPFLFIKTASKEQQRPAMSEKTEKRGWTDPTLLQELSRGGRT